MLQKPHVGSSDPEANFPTQETGSLVNAPGISPTLKTYASDHPTALVG